MKASLQQQPMYCSWDHNYTSINSIWLIWWWEPSWILPSWIQPFCTKLWLKLIQSDSDSFILTQLDDVRHHEFCHLGFSHFGKKKLHSFILTQFDDGSHLELCHVGFRHCHLGFRHLVIFSQIHTKTLSLHSESDSNQFNLINLMMAAIFKCAILVLANLNKTLTQTNSIWLKLIHSDSTWWCQPSWNLPCKIQALPSWIQTPCYLLSDSLKNTLTPL